MTLLQEVQFAPLDTIVQIGERNVCHKSHIPQVLG